MKTETKDLSLTLLLRFLLYVESMATDLSRRTQRSESFQLSRSVELSSCFEETSWREAIKESPRRCPMISFAVKCRVNQVCPQQFQAIEPNMPGAISLILMVILLLFSSLADAIEMQSNTSTSKCAVGTTFRLKTN